jgi:hypothetical protein
LASDAGGREETVAGGGTLRAHGAQRTCSGAARPFWREVGTEDPGLDGPALSAHHLVALDSYVLFFDATSQCSVTIKIKIIRNVKYPPQNLKEHFYLMRYSNGNEQAGL